MSITFTDNDIERWVKDGVQSAINSALRDGYRMGSQLKVVIEKAIKESEPEILAGVKDGITKACLSPGFLQSIEKEIAASLASQYRGAFDGVVRAAAKQAANTEVVARRIVELTQQAAGINSGK